jgi:hypothetical protein
MFFAFQREPVRYIFCTFVKKQKNKVMAQIIIEYDARSSVARKLIDFIMSSNIVKVKEVKKDALDEAIEDVENGNVYSAKNAKDLINKCLQ